MKVATSNLITEDGEYLIKVWCAGGYWGDYTHKGHVTRMDNPKRGHVIQMPFGEMYKITALGTVNLTLERGQEHAVFLKEFQG